MGRVRHFLSYLTSRAGVSSYTSVTESPQPKFLLLYRFAAFLLAGLTVFVGIEVTTHNYFLFLTHWGVMAVAGYFTLVLGAYSYEEVRPVAYLAFEAAVVLELIVVIGFWVTVYPFLTFPLEPIYNLTVHGGLFLLLCVDYSLNRIAFVPRHYTLPALILALYTLLNAWVSITVQPIYPLITFTDVTSYVIMTGIFLFGFLCHRSLSCLDRVKAPLDLPETKFELGPILKA